MGGYEKREWSLKLVSIQTSKERRHSLWATVSWQASGWQASTWPSSRICARAGAARRTGMQCASRGCRCWGASTCCWYGCPGAVAGSAGTWRARRPALWRKGTNNMTKTKRTPAYCFRDTQYFFSKIYENSRKPSQSWLSHKMLIWTDIPHNEIGRIFYLLINLTSYFFSIQENVTIYSFEDNALNISIWEICKGPF